jgi:hypothetical protein
MSLDVPDNTAALADAVSTRLDLDFDPDALRAKYRQERDARLRPDANDQYIEVKGDFRHYVDDPYVEPGSRGRRWMTKSTCLSSAAASAA